MATFNNNFDEKTVIGQLNQAETINNHQSHSGIGDNVGGNKITGNNNVGGNNTQVDTVGNVGGDYTIGDKTGGDKNTNSKNTSFNLAITVSLAIALGFLFGTETVQSFLDQIFKS